jgi:hypothetical protein
MVWVMVHGMGDGGRCNAPQVVLQVQIGLLDVRGVLGVAAVEGSEGDGIGELDVHLRHGVDVELGVRNSA